MSDDEELKKRKDSLLPNVPLQLGFPAGSCAKCGAPYFRDSYTGHLKPICGCWNLPKIKVADNTEDK